MLQVLFVDDEPELRSLLTAYIEETDGIAFTTADSARDALASIRGHPYDVVVSDYLMPGMNGIEFLKELRGSGNTVPFIILTCMGENRIAIDALNNGASFFVQKTGDFETLARDLVNKIRQSGMNHRTEMALIEHEELFRSLVDNMLDPVIILGFDGTLHFSNRAASRLIENPVPGDKNHTTIFPFVEPDSVAQVKADLEHIRMRGKPATAEYRIRTISGDPRWVEAVGVRIRYKGNDVVLASLRDITGRKRAQEDLREVNENLEHRIRERTEVLTSTNEMLEQEVRARKYAEEMILQSLREKDLLLREIHHRVKNNLQVVSSLINLQLRTIRDPVIHEAIKDCHLRVRAMALVHEQLYRSTDISVVDLGKYLERLASQIFQYYGVKKSIIIPVFVIEPIPVPIDTLIPLGLIMNELLTNSLRHAFPASEGGEVLIRASCVKPGQVEIEYSDNGKGISPDLDIAAADSLGIKLMNMLISQMDGRIELGPGLKGGTRCILRFPLRSASSSNPQLPKFL